MRHNNWLLITIGIAIGLVLGRLSAPPLFAQQTETLPLNPPLTAEELFGELPPPPPPPLTPKTPKAKSWGGMAPDSALSTFMGLFRGLSRAETVTLVRDMMGYLQIGVDFCCLVCEVAGDKDDEK